MPYATQTRPASAALGLTNWAISATIAAQSSQATYYPATALLDPHRSRRWRSTDVSIAQTVTFDLGSALKPTLVGLVDYNGTTGDLILKGATNSAITTGVQTYTFAWPGQWSDAKVIAFYPTADDSGGAAAAKQYWQLTFPADATGTGDVDAFHEIGAVWLGTYSALDAISDVSVDTADDSDIADSYGGARYADALRPYHNVSLSVETLDLANVQVLRALLAAQRQAYCLLDLHGVSTNPYLYPFGRFYGLLDLDGGLSVALRGGNDNTIDLSFIEARG